MHKGKSINDFISKKNILAEFNCLKWENNSGWREIDK